MHHHHRRLLLPLLLLTLAGCVSTKEVYTPDGRQGHTIDCSGDWSNWGHCYQRASDLCGPRGYEIFTGVNEQGMAVFAGPQVMAGGTTTKRTLLIACKGQ